MICLSKFATLAFASAAFSSAAEGAEIIAIPGDYVFTHQANPGKGYYDIMLQTLVIHNDSSAPATLTGLQIDILGEGPVSVSKNLSIAAALRKSAEFAGMAAAGLGVFLNAQLLNENGLAGVTGGPATLAADAELAPGDAVILTGQYFALDFAPAKIAVTATFVGANGKIETARRTLKARASEPSLVYLAPLKGEWLVRALPNIDSHHRYIPSNEFALDFFQTGRTAPSTGAKSWRATTITATARLLTLSPMARSYLRSIPKSRTPPRYRAGTGSQSMTLKSESPPIKCDVSAKTSAPLQPGIMSSSSTR